MNKYRNKKVIMTRDGTIFEVDELKRYNITDVTGIKFDSKMEANYYKLLLAIEAQNVIDDIELQPVFILQQKPLIKYIADFKVKWMNGEEIIYDVKGMQTTAFRLKLRLMKSVFPDVSLVLVSLKGNKFIENKVS